MEQIYEDMERMIIKDYYFPLGVYKEGERDKNQW